jgi:malonate-semialdehyde dehydrogenase (acetylating)/methylmalonate-semialdehyde dehydrogenase
MSVSVTVAVGNIGDQLVEAIAARLPKLVIGNGAEDGVDMGPLITSEHRDKVAGYIGAGEKSGATVVVDGRTADLPETGFFLGTTLLDHVTTDMSVYTDEIFGPVLSVVRVDTYADALALINSNPFANGTAIFTRDGGAARRFQFDVEVGMVGINVPIPVPVAYYSFGGWRDSLFGDTHIYGPEGINFYTRAKVVTSRWPDPGTSSMDLGFPRNR